VPPVSQVPSKSITVAPLPQKREPTPPLHNVSDDNDNTDTDTKEPSREIKFRLGDRNFSIDAATLSNISLRDLYEDLGFPESDNEESDDDEPVAKKVQYDIFPNVETFLWYLLYQQEGSNR